MSVRTDDFAYTIALDVARLLRNALLVLLTWAVSVSVWDWAQSRFTAPDHWIAADRRVEPVRGSTDMTGFPVFVAQIGFLRPGHVIWTDRLYCRLPGYGVVQMGTQTREWAALRMDGKRPVKWQWNRAPTPHVAAVCWLESDVTLTTEYGHRKVVRMRSSPFQVMPSANARSGPR